MDDFKTIWKSIIGDSEKSARFASTGSFDPHLIGQAPVTFGDSFSINGRPWTDSGPGDLVPFPPMAQRGVGISATIPIASFTGPRMLLLRVILKAVFGTDDIPVSINGIILSDDPGDREREALEVIVAEAEMLKARGIIEGTPGARWINGR